MLGFLSTAQRSRFARPMLTRGFCNLAKAIEAVDVKGFQKALIRTDSVWLRGLDRPAEMYVAQQWFARPQHGEQFHSMFRTLMNNACATNLGYQFESDTPISTLAGIDDFLVAELLEDIFDKHTSRGDFKLLNINGVTDSTPPIVRAAQTGCLNSVYVLWLFKANVNQPEVKHGNTALHFACAYTKLDMIKALTAYGANPHKRNKYNQVPFNSIISLEKDLPGRQLLVSLAMMRGQLFSEQEQDLKHARAKPRPW